ncbi:nucleotidyl transferase AbiEii/AbiGii toxin family protein [Kitasatospora sp. NPDC051984]|uniref:nucleotidyl transferase AbiEii/AbiGii toxin family protein n=1 Tax=Kitasatospora sp. NPDC051984 TaxID=3364059 RepID=UPI0037CA67CF
MGRRAVLDHLVALLAESAWGDALVLRGSMVLPAWVGEAAREPADLDWVVEPSTLVPVDLADPHPYVEELTAVQQWPEAADGAARYEMWAFEEFETRGLRAHLPPEGCHWVPEAETDTDGPEAVLRELIARHPVAAPGIALDPDSVRVDGGWTYQDDGEVPGVRIAVRWTADGRPAGEVSIDFARDERLPEPPVLTALPRGDGAGATVVRTASRELSLAWKLLWLHADSHGAEGRARAKDLYDAVLLAEVCTLTPGLLRRVLAREPGHPGRLRLDTLAVAPSDWADLRAADPRITGTADEWLGRLRTALAPLHP